MWEDYLMNGGNLLVLPASSSPEVQNKFLQKIQAPRYDKRDTNTVIAHIETQAAYSGMHSNNRILKQYSLKSVSITGLFYPPIRNLIIG